MIVVDANLLIYAYDPESRLHGAAKKWLEEVFSGPDPVRLPWSTIHAFLRLLTNPRLYRKPLSIREAAAIVDSWLAQPAVDLLEPGERYWAVLRRLFEESQIRGPLLMDAHLAALAIEHGATLCTTDRDFTRFDRLKLLDPLLAK